MLHITWLVSTTDIHPFTYCIHNACRVWLSHPMCTIRVRGCNHGGLPWGSGCGAAFCSVWDDVVMSPKKKPATRHFVSMECHI
jgi:hypothetical protein